MISKLLFMLVNIYLLGLFVYAVLSWIKDKRAEEFKNKIAGLYEPALMPIRGLLKKATFIPDGLDLSPIALFILISIAKGLLMPIFNF